jgi:hypothetical protein
MARISTAASLSMCSGVPLRFPGLQNREVKKCCLFISTAALLSMCSGVPLRFPGLHNTERFKNIVFSSPLLPCSACARVYRYASPFCTIQRGLKMSSFHLHCHLAQHVLGCGATPVCKIVSLKNVVFPSPLPPRSACARGCRYYAFPVCTIQRGLKMFFFSSPLPPCSACARVCRYAFPVCTIQRG